MPPTGGITRLERSYAANFCRRGHEVILVDSWRGKFEQSLDLSVHQRLLKRAQDAIQTVITEYNFKEAGILGTSVGGIHAATALMKFSEIKKALLIVAGAPVADVIAESEQSDLAAVRTERMKKFGFKNVSEYKLALREAIDEEPLSYIDGLKDKQVAMVVAEKDKVVATKYQRQLVEALDPDWVLEYPNGHVLTIGRFWWFQTDRVLDFFAN